MKSKEVETIQRRVGMKLSDFSLKQKLVLLGDLHQHSTLKRPDSTSSNEKQGRHLRKSIK
jgi:hypothetical protein